jgi:hypothetical protein
MSTLQTTNLKHPDSGSNNIKFDSSGNVQIGEFDGSDYSKEGSYIYQAGQFRVVRETGSDRIYSGFLGSTQTVDIRASGSVSLADDLTIDVNTTGFGKINFKNTQTPTSGYWAIAGDADGDLKYERRNANGSFASAPFIVSADGSSTFGVFPNSAFIGQFQFVKYNASTQANVVCRKTDSLFNSNNAFEVQNNTSAVTAFITGNGSAQFKDGSSIVAGINGGSAVFYGGDSSTTSQSNSKFRINSNGSATFGGDLSINDNSFIRVRQTGDNTSTAIQLSHDGTGTFTGSVKGTRGIFRNNSNSSLIVGVDNINDANYSAIQLKPDGTATFAKGAFDITASGTAQITNPSSNADAIQVYGPGGNTVFARVKNNGEAQFGNCLLGVSSSDGVTKLQVNAGTSATPGGANSIGIGSTGVSLFATRITGNGNFALDRIYSNVWSNALSINRQNGSFNVVGHFSKGSGSFRISHPLPSKTDTHHLVHSFIEGPQADLIYRGYVDLIDGQATVNIDTAARMTEGTFEVLCTNVSCFTSNESDWTAVVGSVTGNVLTITAQDPTATSKVSWMVVGERKDQHMLDTDWTDDTGRVITEPMKVVDATED